MECSQESGRKEDSKAEARKISRNEKAKNKSLPSPAPSFLIGRMGVIMIPPHRVW